MLLNIYEAKKFLFDRENCWNVRYALFNSTI